VDPQADHLGIAAEQAHQRPRAGSAQDAGDHHAGQRLAQRRAGRRVSKIRPVCAKMLPDERGGCRAKAKGGHERKVDCLEANALRGVDGGAEGDHHCAVDEEAAGEERLLHAGRHANLQHTAERRAIEAPVLPADW